MAGIYVHIPFCKSRCKYCDFFSTTQLHRRTEYVEALLKEIALRKEEIEREPIHTIYFGGGTPSLLSAPLLSPLMRMIASLNTYQDGMEITLEANPQDLTLGTLQAYKAIGINRLSIGIQSFHDTHLQLLGRRHSAAEAIQAVQWAQEAGFDNISIDLIYGIPTQTMAEWQHDIQQAIDLGVQHISSYNLIYEEGTCLTHMLTHGLLYPVDEELENQMYESLVQQLAQHGFEHYEISNFARQGYHSRHNSSYWNGTPYSGLGAGAHSLRSGHRMLNTGCWTKDTQAPLVRSWNVADLDTYITSIHQGVLPYEQEELTPTDIYNERIMLGLRTNKGIALAQLSHEEQAYCLHQAQKYLSNGLLCLQDKHLIASLKGTEILNQIITDLMK